jgi:hypothetical protein
VSSSGHRSPTQIRARLGRPWSTRDECREFTFANAVRLWGTGNPRFFEGTAVAKAAAPVLEGRDA